MCKEEGVCREGEAVKVKFGELFAGRLDWG